MIDTDSLPPEFMPLWEAFRDEMFSPRGKRTPLFQIKVTVLAVDMEKALKAVCRLNRQEEE